MGRMFLFVEVTEGNRSGWFCCIVGVDGLRGAL